MPVFLTLYVAYSIAVVGYCLSNYAFKTYSLSFFEKYLLGYALLSYTGLVFMVLSRFPIYTAFLHGATLVSTLLIFIESLTRPLNIFNANAAHSYRVLFGGAILAVLAFYFRFPVSNFIYEIGDAGAYINSANHLARDGIKSTQFFPLSQIWFAIFSSLGGKTCTAWAAPFFSLHAVIAIYYLSEKVFKSTQTALIAMALLATNIIAVWFARLPYSESLMTFLNTSLLYLFFNYAVITENEKKPFLLLIPLYVGLASLTRVTGIVWMAAISLNLGYQLLIGSRQCKGYFNIFIFSFFGYSLSVAYGLIMARQYYITWQLKEYLPFLNTPTVIVVFHICWLIAGISIYILFRSFSVLRNLQIKKYLVKNPFLFSIFMFIFLLLIGNIIFTKKVEALFPIAFVKSILNGDYPQDIYYLIHFFGILSVICFPIGLYFAFKFYNPIKNPNYAIPWFFSLGFFTIYYSRVLHQYAHAVYLYYLRYFLSEMTILFLLILCAFFHHSFRANRFLKITSVLFLGFYFFPSFYWISVNANSQYLENSFEILSAVESSIPPENSVIFVDVNYDGKWVYPGFDQCFLLPLKHSFGYKISMDGKPQNPYHDPYNLQHLIRVVSNPDKLLTAYVLSISKYGERTSPDFTKMPGALAHQVKRIKSYVKAKGHNPGNIFRKQYSRHDIVIDIWQVKRFYLIPYHNSFISQSGFFHRSIWTDGNGKFEEFHYTLNKNDKYIILGTYGYNPLRDDREKLKLEVRANKIPLSLSHTKNNTFYFHLPENLKHINSVEIKSNIFVPKDFGINDSEKRLGMDVKFITIG